MSCNPVSHPKFKLSWIENPELKTRYSMPLQKATDNVHVESEYLKYNNANKIY